MPKKEPVPDAWDDDWENLADKPDSDKKEDKTNASKLSKSERRAQHAEFNRQLWQSAENPPEPMMFLESRNSAPIKSDFKPNVMLLSRKPPAQATPDMAGLKLQDDEDSEEERRKQNEASFAERQARAQRERAEKERRYAEAREKLFGSQPPSDEGRASPNRRGKGRGRGGRDRDSQPRLSNEQSPARPPPSGKQLFDPTYSPKPGSLYIQKKESGNSRPTTPNGPQQPIREPRGPQAIGRGGRGFVPRGGHSTSAA
ncbi:hypothetical protein EJ04DRAFT_261160 [Polyplosphaeria fusca]|uniref:SUZ domain-containing protein n=1 Tax=Polyplosphaeria fusca TaxID=682080 RepID=A0A9P4RBE9_9PLEO|nr:hypothetical protein EJ04DRAFT_261160 [Polyplosphaeria fusca]